ncbi:MAG TPA: signal peptidase I [Thermoanaerobaculia bacterium]|nr:signal peptidase I [Thermoanaerobaculia bacterium]
MGPDVPGGAVAAPAPRGLRERADPLLAAVVFALFARTFLFQAFVVPSASMEKNVLTGDRLVVDKFVYAPRPGPAAALLPGRAVRRGDVVVFRYPPDPRRDFIKRVVGLPGETIAIRDKRVFVDGRLLDEPYAFHADDTVWPDDPSIAEGHRRRDQAPPFRVPADSYYVLGDNRDDSNDSRYWGPVPAGHLEGRALFVYWSFLPRPSDAPTGFAAVARWPRDVAERTRWDRFFRPVR